MAIDEQALADGNTKNVERTWRAAGRRVERAVNNPKFIVTVGVVFVLSAVALGGIVAYRELSEPLYENSTFCVVNEETSAYRHLKVGAIVDGRDSGCSPGERVIVCDDPNLLMISGPDDC